MTYKTLIVEKRTNYNIVTMNRPQELNSLSQEMRQELQDCFAQQAQDNDVSAVILTGGDYIFSAGVDIKEMVLLSSDQIDDYCNSISECLKQIYNFNKPVIAAVGGIALGGGFNLATVCDMIIASESAIFSHPELKFGLNPLFTPLKELVGKAKAKEITMIGEPIAAQEALRIGLVNKVFPPDRLMAEAVIMAEELSQRSLRAIEAIKKISRLSPQLETASLFDVEFGLTALLFSRTETKKHMMDFLEELKMRKRDKAI
jgi:enoyl-CoA hydratase